MKTRAPRQPLLAPITPGAEPPLSPLRAFVVQFREEPEATPWCFVGRVEHMTSGHATRFHSPKELLAFFMHVLSPIRAKPP